MKETKAMQEELQKTMSMPRGMTEGQGEKKRRNFNSALHQLLSLKKIEKRDPKQGSSKPTWYPNEDDDDNGTKYSFTKI